MLGNDLIGLIAVYIYVCILLLGIERLIDKNPHVNRKILHILTGNIVLILPLFETREVMTFLAAGPFLVFTFLMSDYSPPNLLSNRVSGAGHRMGLVYYSIAWIILAYVFFGQKIIIAAGMIATSYGDGMASLIGSKHGTKKFDIGGGEKSLEGSLSMFVFTLLSISLIFAYYSNVTGFPALKMGSLSTILLISLIATLTEASTPKGLDNLTIPITASILLWYMI